MNRLREVEKWYAENQGRISAQCRHAKMGKTSNDDLADGWVWITLEAGSKIMQIRVLNGGGIEGTLWDENSSTETFLDELGIAPPRELSMILDRCFDLVTRRT